jgi:hypothetical protein
LYVADEAKKLGLKSVTLAEFGVANGAGLLNICLVAQRVTKATGIEFDIYGFDSGKGMPPLTHPLISVGHKRIRQL